MSKSESAKVCVTRRWIVGLSSASRIVRRIYPQIQKSGTKVASVPDFNTTCPLRLFLFLWPLINDFRIYGEVAVSVALRRLGIGGHGLRSRLRVHVRPVVEDPNNS